MDIALSPEARGPLYRRLFETLRHAIVDGSLPPASRLPATRQLASQLDMSRNTVNTAYDMLAAEGYVVARTGSGFYVTTELPEQGVEIPGADRQSADRSGDSERPGLSRRGRRLALASRPVPGTPGPAFQRGLPALDEFPFRQWQQHLARHSRGGDRALLTYRDDGGLPALKSALRDYLQVARGVRCDPEQVVIVSGGQAALDLLARMLVDAGEPVAIEEPGYLGARDALLAAGADLRPTPVDEDGLCVERLDPDVRLVYVTPSYQFPLGVTLSGARRLQLLQWAAARNACIIEDDYDSEFRFAGKPLSCMQGLDTAGRVAYVGTFSKVMYPALRLGYMVVPTWLAPACGAALRKTGQDTPLVIQAAMADFIRSGQFAAHIRRMRRCYADRQALFVSLARRHLAGLLDVMPTHAGMQLVGYLGTGIDEVRVPSLAASRRLDVGSLSAYYLAGRGRPGIFLGYAGIPEREMETAILTLREVLLEARL